jgi:hypothetical protein
MEYEPMEQEHKEEQKFSELLDDYISVIKRENIIIEKTQVFRNNEKIVSAVVNLQELEEQHKEQGIIKSDL